MKKRFLTIIFASTFLATGLFSQTINEKIDKQIRDPKARESSGKADVYIQKKMIYDSVSITKTNKVPGVIIKEKSIVKRKKSK